MTNITEKIDILLQGPLSDYTIDAANTYLTLHWVNNIIISCWDTCQIPNFTTDGRIILVKNKDVQNRGIGNRNRQIKTTREGLNYVKTEFLFKLRTDMKISLDGMNKWYKFINENKEPLIKFENNDKLPFNQMFVAGNFSQYPFHPRDHVFIGNTLDMVNFFNIPYDKENDVPWNIYMYNNLVRAEIYLASFYCAKFNREIYKFIDNPKQYLVDYAPERAKAMNISKEIIDKVIRPLPRVEFDMPKNKIYGLSHYGNSSGEYWND